MPAPREIATIVDAARLYYEQGRSQTEVAALLGLSRSNISRVLAEARERGIVEFVIHDPLAPPVRDQALGARLADEFSLREAVVVRSSRRSGLDTVARAAAAIVQDRATEVSRLGVSWGLTVQQIVSQLPRMELRTPPRVLPLVGGLSALDELKSGDVVLRVLADRIGAGTERLYAPAILESAGAAPIFLGESSIASVLADAADVEFALVGIGSVGVHSSPHLIERMRLDQSETAQLQAQEPAGDVCARFVTADGSAVGPPVSERVLAVTLEQLADIPDVLGAAAGAEKATGVLGVLRSGVLNTLVIDDALALALLDRM